LWQIFKNIYDPWQVHVGYDRGGGIKKQMGILLMARPMAMI